MPKGARRLGRGVISPELRECVARGVREGRFSLRSLGAAVGFPDSQTVSRQLHGQFATSPRTLERWQRVAQMAGFADDEPVVVVREKAHE